jgi:hypothetical protein
MWFSTNFARQQHYSHKITTHRGGGDLGKFALGPLEETFYLHKSHCRARRRPATRPRRVLAGGEVAGGGERVWHDLQSPRNSLGGVVLDGQQRDMVGDGEARRPWRRKAVPGEGPTNIGV